MRKREFVIFALTLMALVFIIILQSRGTEYVREECWAYRETESLIVARDLQGNLWEFEVPSYVKFDKGWVDLRMNDNRTPEVLDDKVIDVIFR